MITFYNIFSFFDFLLPLLLEIFSSYFLHFHNISSLHYRYIFFYFLLFIYIEPLFIVIFSSFSFLSQLHFITIERYFHFFHFPIFFLHFRDFITHLFLSPLLFIFASFFINSLLLYFIIGFQIIIIFFLLFDIFSFSLSLFSYFSFVTIWEFRATTSISFSDYLLSLYFSIYFLSGFFSLLLIFIYFLLFIFSLPLFIDITIFITLYFISSFLDSHYYIFQFQFSSSHCFTAFSHSFRSFLDFLPFWIELYFQSCFLSLLSPRVTEKSYFLSAISH